MDDPASPTRPTSPDPAGPAPASPPAWAPPEPPPVAWAAPPPQPGPAPGIQYAGFWIRLGAYLIDAIPLLVLSFVFLLPLFGAMGEAFRDIPPPPRGTPVNSPEYQEWQRLLTERLTSATASVTSSSGLVQLASIAYFVGFWAWRGATPGMMLLGLRIARDVDGTPPGLGRSILRYIGYFISALVLFIGFIWIAFDSKKQGWHDKLAGTVVVRRSG
jgi:uncharacterized RDD family membrane protein YckC